MVKNCDENVCTSNSCIKRNISFNLNGKNLCFSISPNESLLNLLRRNNYLGTKYGCGEGTCGACTVIVNGKAMYSCVLYAFKVDGCVVETIEGLGSSDKLNRIQEEFINAGAVQCGYCIPGMIMAAKSMFDEFNHPSEKCIKIHMDGNLCRCTGYEKIYDALDKIAKNNSK